MEFYGLVRQMNSDSLRRIDSIRVFLGREGGRLNHNFTGESAELGSQYSHMLDQATRTAQSAKNLQKKRGVKAAEYIADLREEIEVLRQPEYKAQFARIREEERTKILDFVGWVSDTLVGTNSAELEKHRLTRLIEMLEQEQAIAQAAKRRKMLSWG